MINEQEDKEILEDKTLAEIADELMIDYAQLLPPVQDSDESPRRNCLTAFKSYFDALSHSFGTLSVHYIPCGKSLVVIENKSKKLSGAPEVICLKHKN